MALEVKLSGTGGQGIILIGMVLAEAAATQEGKEVVQSEAYGGEVRGGAVGSEVLIGEEGEEIEYPAVINPDILLAMSQEAADRFTVSVKKNGLILLDSSYVLKEPNTAARIYSIPLTIITKEKLGTTLGANIVALGVLVGLTNVLSKEALEWALLKRVPKGTEEANRKALQIGFEVAEEIKRGTKFSA
jgi:2-oxoglutarate ferredoxin oxidoreductase subunit gamma